MSFRDELITLFRDTVLSENEDDAIKEFNGKVDSILKANQPQKLFRFRPCNTLNFDALQRNQYYASAPSQFNDPFDTFMPTDDSDLEELYMQINDVVGMRMALDETGKLPAFHQNLWNADLQASISSKLRNIPIDMLLKLQVIAKTKGEQDLARIKKETGRYVNYAQNTAWVACFSEDVNSNLMWSHYADDHKGFVLEYDFLSCKANEAQLENLFPVLYSDEPYNAKEVISWFVLRDNGMLIPFPDVNYWIKACLFKATEWAYEKEWRILKQREENAPLYESFELIPSAIIYGRRMSNADYNILHKIVKLLGIKEYKMQPVKGNKTYDMESVAL